MSIQTPRRSTRGQVFTPSFTAPPSPRAMHPNIVYEWNSKPLSVETLPDGTRRIRHKTLKKIRSRRNGTPLKFKKADEVSERHFSLGDGVLVKVEGNRDGVGILVGLWQEEPPTQNQKQGSDGEEGEEDGPRMMSEIHWAYRREDMPSVMKSVQVEDNEVLLGSASSLTRERYVRSIFPVESLERTVVIYSPANFEEHCKPPPQEAKSRKIRANGANWAYVFEGVYWCRRACDKFAKGHTIWTIDIDQWREDAKRDRVYQLEPQRAEHTEVPEENQTDIEEDIEEGKASSEESEGVNEDAIDEPSEPEEEVEEDKTNKRKRKRLAKANASSKKSKKTKIVPKKVKRPAKRTAHPTASTSNLPVNPLAPDQLPVDPFERALRMLHVGATPESLPCREEEFVDVLSKVEDGVESGGGGCLYIAGVPGTGKTATVHAVVKELKRKAEDGELPPFSYIEINGLKIPTPQHAYTVLWEAISGAKGASAKTALRGLEAHFGRKGGGARGPRGHTFVVLMDELDQLLTTKQDVVYNFFNWPTMPDSQLFVIAVANRMDLPQHLAAKIKSRLGLQTILFQPYDRASLISIVQSRLIPHPRAPNQDPKVLLPDAIALAATKMAGTNGDARRVLDACRRAVEVAIETSASSQPLLLNAAPLSLGPQPVNSKAMNAVLVTMSSSPVAKFIETCSLQQKMMLGALVRCVRREGITEIAWKNIKVDLDALTRSMLFDTNKAADTENRILSNSELALVLSSLVSSHALACSSDISKGADEKTVALGMEIGEVGRVLMGQSDGWRRIMAGV
ncbi:hypothetical protein L204_101051 [Cryptococcus depauperatus]|nr:origin recognition complex subunit 1 [Cryptococcus depauperatus CBS 7855]